MLEALAYVLTERRRMLRALIAMGLADAYELEPRGLLEHVEALRSGGEATLGTAEDPFVLKSEDRIIARYYIEADGGRCWVRLSGSAEFIATLALLALRDGGASVH